MTRLNSRQRKWVYAGGIVVLLAPIVVLGYPGRPVRDPATGRVERMQDQGQLAALREQYELGETNFGDVDPTSSAMNFVLLGLRGVAANVVWSQALEDQKRHRWQELASKVNTIIQLEPHFIEVWEHQAWNLSYNVSAQWDGWRDRYHWVREGVLFLQDGVDRNRRVARLPHTVGFFIMHKIGRSDEQRWFRERYRTWTDPEVNLAEYEADRQFSYNPETLVAIEGRPHGDNFLVARGWFAFSSRRALENPLVHIPTPVLFHSGPAKALIAYADVLDEEFDPGEETQIAWYNAFAAWTAYGRGRIPYHDHPDLEFPIDPPVPGVFADNPEGPRDFRLEYDNGYVASQLTQLSEEERYWVDRYQNMVNYRGLRLLCEVQQQRAMQDAHGLMNRAWREYTEGTYSADRTLEDSLADFRQGMELYAGVLEQFRRPGAEESQVITDSRELMEEALIAGIRYSEMRNQLGEPGLQPGDPLYDVWQRHGYETVYMNVVVPPNLPVPERPTPAAQEPPSEEGSPEQEGGPSGADPSGDAEGGRQPDEAPRERADASVPEGSQVAGEASTVAEEGHEAPAAGHSSQPSP